MAQQALGRVRWGGLEFGPGTPYTVAAVEGLRVLCAFFVVVIMPFAIFTICFSMARSCDFSPATSP